MKKILSLLRKACENYSLIEKNDRIAVGISGGKDSLILLKALVEYKKYFMSDLEIIPISIDLTNGKNNYDKINKFCEELNTKLTVVKSNIFEIVFDIRKEKNPCSLCANLRRGILNSTAKDLGCNKIALGHHRDDLIETFILSLFFEGRLSTFKPKMHLSRMDLTVIRPLIYVEESQISKVEQDLPILKNICPADKNTQREHAKNILKLLEREFPNCKEKLFNSIINKDRYNLF